MPEKIISHILGLEVLDSRGNPTIEVDVQLKDGSFGRAIVPSGASTGKYEAVELRDGDNKRYIGRGVLNALNNVNKIIAKQLIGMNALNQAKIDQTMIALDGTSNKSRLGANAILGVSMACAVASSKFYNCPLYHYLNKDSSILPVPMINVLNGGMHADGGSDIQEIMIFPIGAISFSEAIRMGAEIFHELKKELKSKGLTTTVGDEGGFAPQLKSNEHAIELLLGAIDKAGYQTGKDVFLALDVAASSFYQDNKYHLSLDNQIVDDEGMIKFYERLINQYPIVSIEDGLDENDWKGWTKLNASLGNRIQIVGDDLTVTNPKKLNKAISENTINSILIKLNQIGTVSETIETINLAKNNNYDFIIPNKNIAA